MKAVVIAIDGTEEQAESIARLLAAALTDNGFDAGPPAVIDWPVATREQQ